MHDHKDEDPAGSPPQVRGKPLSTASHASVSRITPAGAGKTEKGIPISRYIEDHPRRCGENFGKISLVFHVVGSPPQVRGKQKPSRVYPQRKRITPAGAGKTRTLHEKRPTPKVGRTLT